MCAVVGKNTGYAETRTQSVKPDRRLQTEAWTREAAPVAVLMDGWGPVGDATAVVCASFESVVEAAAVAVAAVE